MKKNVVFSLVSFFSSIVLAFFVSPMILRRLGDVRYGTWALFGELLSYYGLLDFGIRGAVNYFVGKSLATDDERQVHRYFSSGFFGLVVIAMVVMAAMIPVIFVFRKTLAPNPDIRFEVVASAYLFTAIFCASLPIEAYAAALVGSRRAYLVSVAETVSRVVTAVLMFAVLLGGPNMLTLAVAQLVGRIVYWAPIVRNSRMHVPEAAARVKDASFSAVRELVSYGGKNALIQFSGLLMNRKDATLITIFLGPQVVATFSFARTAVQSLADVCASMTIPLRPNLVYFWARGEREQCFSLYFTMTRYSTFLVAMASAFLACYGRDFLRLWIGARFVTGDLWYRADLVLMILLASRAPRMIYSMSWQFLFATNRQKAMTIVTTIEVIANTGLALLLVRPYGPVGIAIGALIPSIIAQVIVFPIVLSRDGVPIRRFFTEGLARPVLAGVALALAFRALHAVFPARGWLDLFLAGGILSVCAAVVGWTMILRGDHKRTVFAFLASLATGRAQTAKRARSAGSA